MTVSRVDSTVDQLVALLASGRNTYYALSQLKALSSESEQNKHVIRERGAIPLTIAMLGAQYNHAVHHHAPALSLLRSLSVVRENQYEIGRTPGAVPSLLAYVVCQDTEMQLNAASTLWNLSALNENKRAVCAAGGVDVALRVLANDEHGAAVHYALVGLLRNLCYDAYACAAMIRAAGAMALLTRRLAECEPSAATSERARKMQQYLTVVLHQCLERGGGSGVEALHAVPGGADTLLRAAAAHDPHLYERIHALLVARGGGGREGLHPPPPPLQPPQHRTTHRSSASDAVRRRSLRQSILPAPSPAYDTVEWEALERNEQIGEGAYSRVYHGRYRGFPVAIKVLNRAIPDDDEEHERCIGEFRLMSRLRHPNVTMLMAITTTPAPNERLVIVTEIAARGALKDVLDPKKSPTMPSMVHRMHIAGGIVSGLNWCHANHVIHRDLKPANILVTADWTAKIADFGLSYVHTEHSVERHFRGNVKYSAPEILAVRARSETEQRQQQQQQHQQAASRSKLVYPYGPRSDVYSFALILWELVTNDARRPLFHGIRGKADITRFVCEGGRPPLVEGWPQSLAALLSLAWHADVGRRPLFSQIQAQFGGVLIDVVCPDPLARRIARDLWLEADTNPVSYDRFERTLIAHTGVDLDAYDPLYRRCLQTMVCDDHDHSVTLERFANAVMWFGSMHPVTEFVSRIVALFRQPWFHGFVRGKDAKRMLDAQRQRTGIGCYAVRFSDTTPGAYSMYSIGADGTSVHRRISHRYTSSYAVTLAASAPPREYTDLCTLHNDCLRADPHLHGLVPLAGAPFQCFFDVVPTPIYQAQQGPALIPNTPVAQQHSSSSARRVSSAMTTGAGAPPSSVRQPAVASHTMAPVRTTTSARPPPARPRREKSTTSVTSHHDGGNHSSSSSSSGGGGSTDQSLSSFSQSSPLPLQRPALRAANTNAQRSASSSRRMREMARIL